MGQKKELVHPGARRKARSGMSWEPGDIFLCCVGLNVMFPRLLRLQKNCGGVREMPGYRGFSVGGEMPQKLENSGRGQRCLVAKSIAT